MSQVARGFGDPEEILRAALDVLERQPSGRGFRVGKECIVVEMGEGLEVRVHRTTQAWTVAEADVAHGVLVERANRR